MTVLLILQFEGIQLMWDFAQDHTGKVQSQAFLVQDVYLETF